MTVFTATTKDIVVKSVTIPITDEQIKSWPTNPIEVVPAPADGQFVLIHNAMFKIHSIILGGYSNIDETAAITLVYGIGWDDDASKSMPMGVYLLENVAPSMGLILGLDNGFGLAKATINNKGVFIFFDNKNLGDLTGGDAQNSFSVTVTYSVIDI